MHSIAEEVEYFFCFSEIQVQICSDLGNTVKSVSHTFGELCSCKALGSIRETPSDYFYGLLAEVIQRVHSMPDGLQVGW